SPVGSNGGAWPAQNEATDLRYDHALRCAQGVPPSRCAQGVPVGSNGEPAGDSLLPLPPLPLAGARGEAPSANASNGDRLRDAWDGGTFEDYMEKLRRCAESSPGRLESLSAKRRRRQR